MRIEDGAVVLFQGDSKPDWVSIMIGINDTWRAFDRNDPTSTADYALIARSWLSAIGACC